MTITYGNIFSAEQYRSIARVASKYMRESLKSTYLPLIETDLKDAMVYRERIEGDADASYGTHQWSDGGRRAQYKQGYQDHDLEGIEMEIFVPNNKIKMYNDENFLGEAKTAQITKWLQDIDNAIFTGIVDRSENVKLTDGLIDQGDNTVEDLSSGDDHVLTSKGEIYLAAKRLIEEIPFRIRENFPEGVNIFVTPKLDTEVREPDRIYQDKVEFNFLYENLMGPKASPQLKVKNWIVTEKIYSKPYSNTAGNNADAEDVHDGTNERMLVTVPDRRYCARVQSLFDMIGEERKLLGVHMAYGWRGAGVTMKSGEGVKYSEALEVV